MNFFLTITAASFAMLCSRAGAGPLADAKVSGVVAEVTVAPAHGTPRRAAEQEVLRPDEGLRVGAGSRAEIRFGDGTLARLGAETELGLRRGSRELALERGTLLLEVPGFRGGARVRAGGLTAVCGAATILIEHLPSQSLKIVVLAGDLRVVAAGFFGDSIVIPPGKMLITAPNVKKIPDPVDVDLATLVKTSALINAARLVSLPRIEREIEHQVGSFKAKRLIPTNLAIVGSGTSVVIPGQATPEEEVVSAGESVVVEGGTATEIPNSAEIEPRRLATKPVDQEDSLSEP